MVTHPWHINQIRLSSVALLVVCALSGPTGRAYPLTPQTDTAPQRSTQMRDGQHDFDFNFGVWHTHIKRVLDPLSGSPNSIELNGTVTVRRIWNGRAQLEEIEADGPDGH